MSFGVYTIFFIICSFHICICSVYALGTLNSLRGLTKRGSFIRAAADKNENILFWFYLICLYKKTTTTTKAEAEEQQNKLRYNEVTCVCTGTRGSCCCFCRCENNRQKPSEDNNNVGATATATATLTSTATRLHLKCAKKPGALSKRHYSRSKRERNSPLNITRRDDKADVECAVAAVATAA